jgi:hypothetical protein
VGMCVLGLQRTGAVSISLRTPMQRAFSRSIFAALSRPQRAFGTTVH